VYGAEVAGRESNFDRALSIVRRAADRYPVHLVNSASYRLRARRQRPSRWSMPYGEAPDWLCIPMGNAGNISAYWRVFQEYSAAGTAGRLGPRMMGSNRSGSAPLVLGHT